MATNKSNKDVALPFLPGSTVEINKKSTHGRVQTFKNINGYSVPQNLGSEPNEPLTAEELEELSAATARITYGEKLRTSTELQEELTSTARVPAHVAFDKKVLMFTAFMLSEIEDSPLEKTRVRYFKVYYYLEDDTMSISEPEIANSGMQQGTFLKRQRIPKDEEGNTYHYKDLNLGMDLVVYGRVLRINDCNAWTKDFMVKEEVQLNEPEPTPYDQYLSTRAQIDEPDISSQTPSDFDKFKQFLVLDRKVLRFFGVWDDDSSGHVERRTFIILYYLVDDTVEIRETYPPNCGRDPFPILLQRTKCPRDPGALPEDFPKLVLETREEDNPDIINPSDFVIGDTVKILGRDFLLYDCDEFTKEFYRQNFEKTDEDFEPIDVKIPEQKTPEREIPKHTTGIGSYEDSYRSCLTIVQKPSNGTKSLPKLLKYDNKVLRFEARIEDNPDYKGRLFVISLRLSDDFVSVFEAAEPNSGILPGMFLSPTKLIKPGTEHSMPEYFQAGDFYIGQTVEIYKRKFVIYNADKFVGKFVEENPELYSEEAIEATKKHFEGLPN